MWLDWYKRKQSRTESQNPYSTSFRLTHTHTHSVTRYFSTIFFYHRQISHQSHRCRCVHSLTQWEHCRLLFSKKKVFLYKIIHSGYTIIIIIVIISIFVLLYCSCWFFTIIFFVFPSTLRNHRRTVHFRPNANILHSSQVVSHMWHDRTVCDVWYVMCIA